MTQLLSSFWQRENYTIIRGVLTDVFSVVFEQWIFGCLNRNSSKLCGISTGDFFFSEKRGVLKGDFFFRKVWCFNSENIFSE